MKNVPPNEYLGQMMPGEPAFIIRGNDRLALLILTCWINAAEALGVGITKVNGVRAIAMEFREWQARHGTKIPD